MGCQPPRVVSRSAIMSLALCLALGCNSVTVTVDEDVPLLVTVRGLDGMLLEDVEVCELGTTNCEMTNAEGEALLELPVEQNVAYSLVLQGFGSILAAERTDDAFPSQRTFTMRPEDWIVERCEELKAEYPERCNWPPGGNGHVWIFLANGGVEFRLPRVTREPFYCWYDDESQLHCTFDELSATTPGGGGGFPEVPPGDHILRFEGSVRTCIPDLAWAGSEPNEVTVPSGRRPGLVAETRPR